MTDLWLTYDEQKSGGEICEGDEDNEYPSHEDESIDFTLTGCFLKEKDVGYHRERVTVDFDVSQGSAVWIVVVRYGTGGTFGHIDGAWGIIGIYQKEDEAVKIESSIKDDSYEGYKYWQGYFESFQGVEITKLIVK